MIAVLILTLGALILVLVVLALVVAGIRNEPSAAELTSRPPTLLAALVRRLLGVSVLKPGRLASDQADEPAMCSASTKSPNR
jgi:hypothetical protein